MAKINIFSREKTICELVQITNEYASKSKRNRAYKRKYWVLARKLSAYEKLRAVKLMSNSLDILTIEDFFCFLKDKYPYRSSTLASTLGAIHVIVKYAQNKGYAVNYAFAEYTIHNEDSASVYLTVDEIDIINQLKLSDSLSIVRDRFLLGCCTGLRYSDYSIVNESNIIKNTIQIRTRKTGEKVIIPIHSLIFDILERNAGKLPKIHCSQQYFNATVKLICKKAGINSPILIERTEGNKIIKITKNKYQLVASHTARRSFATNMYLAGIATAKIMMLTGHKTESSFFKYIRIAKQENANELSNHPFFKHEKM